MQNHLYNIYNNYYIYYKIFLGSNEAKSKVKKNTDITDNTDYPLANIEKKYLNFETEKQAISFFMGKRRFLPRK